MATEFNMQDAPSSKLATMFTTIGTQRYAMLNVKNFEAKATVNLSDVSVIGNMTTGKKATGLEIKLSFTVYKCSEMFDDLIEQFKNTGVLPTFECQITNNDGATSIGKSSKIYHNCVIDGDVLLSMFDAEGDLIEQDIEAYATGYDSPNKYNTPAYMM